MGTRGYRVWRYRKIYRIQYNHLDSYPDGLGLTMLRVIHDAIDSQGFTKWIDNCRDWFDSEYEFWLSLEDDDERRSITPFKTEQPGNDLLIEWIYEIDLDNLVFHVDSMPLFRLDCMPDPHTFVNSIGFDYYGQRHYDITTPEQHRYEGILAERAVQPAAQKLLERYSTLDPKIATAAHLLKLPPANSPDTRLNELLVSQLARRRRRDVFQWRAASDWEAVKDVSDFAYTLLVLSIWPKLIPSDQLYPIDPPRDGLDSGYWWLNTGLCVRLVPQLQDEDTMKAAVADMAEVILSKKNQSTTFGILFSVLHISILRISHKDSERVIEHTHALTFLPPFFAETPKTEGISALTALAQSLYQDVFHATVKPSSIEMSTFLAKLPPELVETIGGHLDTDSLLTFASLSDRIFEGCLPVLKLRVPSVAGVRLTGTSIVKEEAITKEELLELQQSEDYEPAPLTCLVSAHFTVDGLPSGSGSSTLRVAPFPLEVRVAVRSDDGLTGTVTGRVSLSSSLSF